MNNLEKNLTEMLKSGDTLQLDGEHRENIFTQAEKNRRNSRRYAGVLSLFFCMCMILSGMLLPALSTSRKKARAAADMAAKKMARIESDMVMEAPLAAMAPLPEAKTVGHRSKKLNAVKAKSYLNNATTQPFSTFGIDTDNRSYIASRTALRNGQRPKQEEVRPEEFINYFGNDTPAPTDGKVFNMSADIARNPFRSNEYTLVLGIRSKEVGRKQDLHTRNIMLVDASGSMALPARWENATECVNLLKNHLQKKSPLKVIYCNDKGKRPSGNSTLEKRLLDTMQVMPEKSGNLFVITDGDSAPQNQAELLRLAEAWRNHDGMINVFDVGDGDLPEFWEKFAEKGGGSLIGINNPDTAKEFIANELDSRLDTIADDVKIQMEFNPAVVSSYRLVGYAERMMKAEDFRNDKYRTSPAGAGQTVTAVYQLQFKDRPEPDTLVGTLRLRYRHVEQPGVDEMAYPITGTVQEFSAMSYAFRNAVIAGELAEYLKYPERSGIATPSGMLQALPANQTGRNSELQELLNLIR